jgi:hypothetical protein
MGRPCGTYGRGKKCMQDFDQDAYREETTWKTGTDGGIILK